MGIHWGKSLSLYLKWINFSSQTIFNLVIVPDIPPDQSKVCLGLAGHTWKHPTKNNSLSHCVSVVTSMQKIKDINWFPPEILMIRTIWLEERIFKHKLQMTIFPYMGGGQENRKSNNISFWKLPGKTIGKTFQKLVLARFGNFRKNTNSPQK